MPGAAGRRRDARRPRRPGRGRQGRLRGHGPWPRARPRGLTDDHQRGSHRPRGTERDVRPGRAALTMVGCWPISRPRRSSWLTRRPAFSDHLRLTSGKRIHGTQTDRRRDSGAVAVRHRRPRRRDPGAASCWLPCTAGTYTSQYFLRRRLAATAVGIPSSTSPGATGPRCFPSIVRGYGESTLLQE